MSTVKINELVMTSFGASKTLRYHHLDAPITSIDFDDSGKYLISSGVDESIQLYDVTKGTHVKPILSKKYGTHLAKFTHSSQSCLYASTKEDDTIRYLSLHDNSYLRYFKGHKAMVTLLEVAPIDDMFISSSLDNTVKMWDLRSANCKGSMFLKNPGVLAFDPTGYVFAVGSMGEIGLYDKKNFDKPPFATFRTNSKVGIQKLEFTNDGNHLVVTFLNNENHLVLDAFDGKLKTVLKGTRAFQPREFPDSGSTTISPDGRFVYGGSGDSKLYIWDLHKINASKELQPSLVINSEQGLPRMTLFNPKLLCLATADKEVSLWIPDLK